ncbi:MAG: type II toxin-antitoxin system HicB family antitoxin [Lactobacillus equicursoris]|nr:type II toxin-antitoxin system HicB family antitoxin [Lactobacillus equicursoris]MDD6386590.1 type II toxin-antitoxin system HicB family antitoxin [Lactobacillus equicursoris]
MMERYVAYPAVLDDTENEKGLYTVTFPDVPGAISEGKGQAKAIVNGSVALGLVLYDEKQLPKASTVEEVQKANPGKTVVVIAADLKEAAKKATPVLVKKNTTIPADLAKKAEEKGINFSRTLVEALQSKLQ